MKKIEIAKKWLNNVDNLEWILNELELWLDNNHDSEMTEIHSILQGEVEDTLTKENAKRLKWTIVADVLQIVQNGIAWDEDIEISEATIKKAMKETDFYNRFNTMFINNFPESDSLEMFKKYFR